MFHQGQLLRPASGRREPLEDAGLRIEPIPLQIVPDVIGFDAIIHQMTGEASNGKVADVTRSALPSQAQAALSSRSPDT